MIIGAEGVPVDPTVLYGSFTAIVTGLVTALSLVWRGSVKDREAHATALAEERRLRDDAIAVERAKRDDQTERMLPLVLRTTDLVPKMIDTIDRVAPVAALTREELELFIKTAKALRPPPRARRA